MAPKALIRIGYWRNVRYPTLPDPHGFVDEDQEEFERLVVATYLSRGFVARSFMGFSECRMCFHPVGSLELSDGTFIWPEGLAHYVLAHSVRLPAEFLDHTRSVVAGLEEAAVSEEWWSRQSGQSIHSRPRAAPSAPGEAP